MTDSFEARGDFLPEATSSDIGNDISNDMTGADAEIHVIPDFSDVEASAPS